MFFLILLLVSLVNANEDYYYDDDGQDQIQTESEDVLNTVQDKLFVANEALSQDPVYNWVLGFSALALFFHAFYTPFGKVTVKKR